MKSLLYRTSLCLALLAALGFGHEAAESNDHRVALPRNPVPSEWKMEKKETSTATSQQAIINLDTEVTVVLAFKRPHVQKLKAYVDDFSNPSSARWGDRLSHMEVTQLVSPGEQALKEVKSWLLRHGVSKIDLARHQDSCSFQASRRQVSSLFKVSWSIFQNEQSGEQSINAVGQVTIPAHLAGVIELVTGLESYPEPGFGGDVHPMKSATGPVPEDKAIFPDRLYQLYNVTEDLYVIPQGEQNIQSFFQATGQAVSATDLEKFCEDNFGTKFTWPCSVEKYVGDQNLPTAGDETAVDSQYLLSVGRRPTWAYTYNSKGFCSDLMSWTQSVFSEKGGTYPWVVSMSYGLQKYPNYCLSEVTRLNEDVMKMGAMGISVLIAAGDSGSGYYGRAGFNGGKLVPSMPSEMPYATAVGATNWNVPEWTVESAAKFSGGGFSWYYDQPSWQASVVDAYMSDSSVTKPTAQYNYNSQKKGRATPDVALAGVNFYIVYNDVITTVSGTSCATPVFAGMISQLNNIRLLENKTLGYLNPFLYQNEACFKDITSGNTANGHGSQYGWNAAKGWDAASGLGSPNFGCLVQTLSGGLPTTPAPITENPVTPPPVTPIPGAPPTPLPTTAAPTPSGPTTWTRNICKGAACVNGCLAHNTSLNVCVPQGSASVFATCNSNGVTVANFESSSGCQGVSHNFTQPINQCLSEEGGVYLENLCN